jgi:anaerobic selenocysteine-containing dehydrogenase
VAQVAYSSCSLCEAVCGLEIEHDGHRVLRIRGDELNPLSRGYICPKGAALDDVRVDPDRLLHPMRRTANGFEPISWDEALALIGERLTAIQRVHGADSVAMYAGNPIAHNYGAILYALLLSRLLGTRNLYTSNSVDSLPRLLASLALYGNQALLPIPDVDRTQFWLILGANPVISNGSVMSAPDIARRLKAIRARGGRVVVIDPRRNETADLAGEHHFIRPGTDALLIAALIREVLAAGLARPQRFADFVQGLDALERLVAPFSAEAVAPICEIDAHAIRTLAHDFARAESAVCYGRLGTTLQEHGSLASYLIDVLNIVTGNLDRPGGAMFSSPAVDLAGMAARLGQRGTFARYVSRVAGLPEFNSELPVAGFAQEMETPGPGQIRGLIVFAGNPVLALPNGSRIERAIAGLEFTVAIDVYLNETSRLAHVVLPPSFGLEHDHFPIISQALGVRNAVQYAPEIFTKPPDTRHDWEILLGIAEAVIVRRGFLGSVFGKAAARVLQRIGAKGLLALMVRFGGRGLTLAELEAAPHGIDFGPLEPRLPGILGGRRIPLVPVEMTEDAARLLERLARGRETGLVLIGRRQLRNNNSWMHNLPRLMKGADRCTVLMSPHDAAERGLEEGQRVRVEGRTGSIELDLERSEDMMPGVVSVPHGFGHSMDGAKLSVASRAPGVSVNDVTDDARIDRLSGCAAVNGVPVEVTPARQPPTGGGRSGGRP